MGEQDFKPGKELIKVLTEIRKAISGEKKENSGNNGNFKQCIINIGENCLGFVLVKIDEQNHSLSFSELYPIDKIFDILNIENIEDFALERDTEKQFGGYFVYGEKPIDNFLSCGATMSYDKIADGVETVEFKSMSIGYLPNGVENYVYDETLGGYIIDFNNAF